MKDKAKRGAPSSYSESLGTGTHYNHYAPEIVHTILKDKNTKKLLNKMALDENIKQKAWELGQ